MKTLSEISSLTEIPPATIYFPDDDIAMIQSELGEILRSGQLVLGERTKKFETEFAEKVGVDHAVAVSSGTGALEIALRSLGCEGKKVIVPANTFYATAAAVIHAGGNLQLVDVDPATWSLDPELVAENIDSETAGIIVVHIGGMVSPAIGNLVEICHGLGKFIMEDAAHAHGSSLNGIQAGSLGDVGTFSFFPTKVMTSIEGGMITTNKDEVAKNARIYRDQGKASSGANYHTHLGNAWRMSEINAVVGSSQLSRLNDFISTRRKIASIYDSILKGSSNVSIVNPGEGSLSNYYKYPLMLRDGVDRDDLKDILKEEYHVRLSGEVYSIPIHQQPVFKGKFSGGPFPVSERLCARQICLPISAVMTKDEAKYVAESLEEAINRICT